MQVGLGLGDHRFHLVQLRQGQEDGGQVAERFVQAARLRWIVTEQPIRFQAIEHGVPRFMRDDVERAAGVDALGGAAGDEVAELEGLVAAAVVRVHDIGQTVREHTQGRCIAGAIPLPGQGRRRVVAGQRALVHGERHAHDGKGVHGIELVGVGRDDEVAEGIRTDLRDARFAKRDARVARALQCQAGQEGLARAQVADGRVLLPDQYARTDGHGGQVANRCLDQARRTRLQGQLRILAVLAVRRRGGRDIADGQGHAFGQHGFDRHDDFLVHGSSPRHAQLEWE